MSSGPKWSTETSEAGKKAIADARKSCEAEYFIQAGKITGEALSKLDEIRRILKTNEQAETAADLLKAMDAISEVVK